MASIRASRRDRQMHMALMLRSRRNIARLRRVVDEINARVAARVAAAIYAPLVQISEAMAESAEAFLAGIEEDIRRRA